MVRAVRLNGINIRLCTSLYAEVRYDDKDRKYKLVMRFTK